MATSCLASPSVPFTLLSVFIQARVPRRCPLIRSLRTAAAWQPLISVQTPAFYPRLRLQPTGEPIPFRQSRRQLLLQSQSFPFSFPFIWATQHLDSTPHVSHGLEQQSLRFEPPRARFRFVDWLVGFDFKFLFDRAHIYVGDFGFILSHCGSFFVNY